jgi:hypothetical protein
MVARWIEETDKLQQTRDVAGCQERSHSDVKRTWVEKT